MAAIASIALFSLLMLAICWVGYRHYVKPGRVYEQLGGAALRSRGEMAGSAERQGAVITVVRKIGKALPISPMEASTARRYLIAAGYRSATAIQAFYGAKVITALGLAAAAFMGRSYLPLNPVAQMAVVAAAGFAGYFLPTLILEYLAKRRQEILRFSLPDALDLLVVCVDAGLAMDQAILNVSRELRLSHKEISEELELVNLEVQAGKKRSEAMRNLGERTGVPEIRKLVAILIQTDRFGTSVVDSLRTHSDFMRVRRRQEAEERAGKIGVKLVFPIFFLILPSMLLVVAGPGLLQIFKQLFPLMRQFPQVSG